MLNENIRKIRMSNSMSQVELAKRLGVSVDNLLSLSYEKTVDVTGLNDTQIAHIRQVINDIKK